MRNKQEAPREAGAGLLGADLTGGAISTRIDGHSPNSQFVERQLQLFGTRCHELADRARAGQLSFIDAIDMAYSAAIWSGLDDSAGDDAVQWVMATVFMGVRRS